MTNPFPDNPVFQHFLGLKYYFRQYINRESFRRTKEISKVARIIQSSGDSIAFDLLGSVNFGIADKKSDVDLVMYLDCGHEEEADYSNCSKLRFYEYLLINTLLHEIFGKTFDIEVVDFLNLRKLNKAIEEEDFEDDIISRFVFYRTICRGVNKKILRPYERAVMKNELLFNKIEDRLTDILVELTKTSGHALSFQKYLDRMKNEDIKIPVSMIGKIKEYLEISKT
ncbi:MAG: nucleotidyltransferase domain-containing protein [Spirochaetia bacterium]|nr:nucleotidyltransferase domain-containing protein [Spirochaetia bacterium]